MNKFVIADTHFGHEAIIKYENRPFSCVKEMDRTLMLNWNCVVSKRDIIYCLGDFSFYNKEGTSEILSVLNGDKRLIMGNHDEARSLSWWLSAGFDRVYDCSICIQKLIWLSHEPMDLGEDSPYFNVHGHTHSNFMIDKLHYANVSVESIGYKPVRLDSVVHVLKKDVIMKPEEVKNILQWKGGQQL